MVDTSGFNDRSWLDTFGAPHSDALHLIERFRRRDIGHMEIQISIDDPKTYTKPLVFTQNVRLLPDTELLENFCENERDAKHTVGSAARQRIYKMNAQPRPLLGEICEAVCARRSRGGGVFLRTVCPAK